MVNVDMKHVDTSNAGWSSERQVYPSLISLIGMMLIVPSAVI